MLLRSLARDSIIYGGADFFTKIVAFIVFPLIAAAMSPHGFGTLELVLTTINLLGLLMNCGMNNATQRFYWDAEIAENLRPSLVSGGLLTQLTLGLLLAGIGIWFAPQIEYLMAHTGAPITHNTLLAALLLLMVIQVTQYLLDVTRLHFAPWKFLVFSSLSRVLTMLAALYAVATLARGVEGYVQAQALVGLALIPLGIYLVRGDITWRIDVPMLKQQIRFGYPFIFAGMAYWLFGSMDRWMLANMSSVEETGIYSVAFRFASIVLFVSAAFGQAWSPYAIKLKSDFPSHYKHIFAHILLLLLFVMLLVGGAISLFSGEIMALFMPDAYRDAAIPLGILAFGIVLQATQQITAIGISLERKTYILALMAWITACVNLLGNWLLIPHYGATGAATATAFSYFVLTAGYIYFTQKLHPLPIAWKKLAVLLLLGGLVLAASILLHSATIEWRGIAAKLTIATLCVGLSLYCLPIRALRRLTAELQPKT